MPNDPPIRFVHVGNLRLAYREWGTRSAPAMVLFHGLALTSAVYWDRLASCFEDRFHIVAFDMLGHGDSDKPTCGYGAHVQADLLNTALDKLGIESAVIVGHSLGGILAAHLAIRHPQRVGRLILANANLPDRLSTTLRILITRIPLRPLLVYSALMLPGAARLADHMPQYRVTRWMLSALHLAYDQRVLTPDIIEQSTRHSTVALVSDIRNAIIRPNVVRDAGSIHAPTMVLDAQCDVFVPIECGRHLAQVIPNARYALLDRAGHYALLDQPELFIHELAEFLSDASD